jgi:hypothetical protein
MAKNLDFKDFLNVDYAPGMPDLIKKNAKKRKSDTGAGSNAEYSSTHPPRKEVTQDPIALGKHAPNIGMGWTGKHRIIKDPGSKTGRHTHVFQYTEQTELDEVSQALGHKVAKARQAQASALRQKAVDEPDMMKAFSHTKAANKAERKAGQSYNRLMRKEEIEEAVDYSKLTQLARLGLVDKSNVQKLIAAFKKMEDGKILSPQQRELMMNVLGDLTGIVTGDSQMFQKAKKAVQESVDLINEALTMQQRRQRARIMKRLAPRIKLGRERAKRRIASPEKLQKRAQRQARMTVFKKLTKDIPKSELTYARRQEIEKRLDKPAVKKRIERLAKRMLPKIRKAEMERRRGTPSND